MSTSRKGLASLSTVCCFQDTIAAIAQILGERLTHEDVLLHHQNSCYFHSSLQRRDHDLCDHVCNASRFVLLDVIMTGIIGNLARTRSAKARPLRTPGVQTSVNTNSIRSPELMNSIASSASAASIT